VYNWTIRAVEATKLSSIEQMQLEIAKLEAVKEKLASASGGEATSANSTTSTEME